MLSAVLKLFKNKKNGGHLNSGNTLIVLFPDLCHLSYFQYDLNDNEVES